MAVILENVSVCYHIPTEKIKSLKEYAIRLLQRRIAKNSFWALRNINLEIKKGENFGIMGINGAGKSTLLKVVSRVLIPSEGRVRIRGSVYPLLQLAAGFHPELTGRENIFLNGTILGHSHKEITDRYSEIIDFSEIGNFIEAPIRTYSSGMQARLGFAIATAWVPEILILDEVLAVGDVAFQQKCFHRMKSFRENGTTIIMVSHSPNTIHSLCQRAMWLDHGQIKAIGSAESISKTYEKAMGV